MAADLGPVSTNFMCLIADDPLLCLQALQCTFRQSSLSCTVCDQISNRHYDSALSAKQLKLFILEIAFACHFQTLIETEL